MLACGVGGGYTPPEPPSPRDATQVNASMGRTWDAVVDLFAAKTIPIRTIERVSGIIVTERLSVRHEDGLAWADCGKVSGFGRSDHISPNYGTYNVLVRGDSSRSSVKTTVRWVHIQPRDLDLEGGGVTECSTKHVWERALETEIKARAEEPRVAHQSGSDSATEPRGTVEVTQQVQTVPSHSEGYNSTSETRSYAAPQSASANERESSGSRMNSELLADPGFNRAVRDLQALKFLSGFQEGGRDTLLVDVSDNTPSTNLSEYNLGHLFSAYYRMNDWNPDTIILFSNRRQVLGAYRRNGLSLREER
jgi:hypothetical protein